jgi:hypothetical protein
MAREKHLVTPVFGFEYPELGAEANVPEDIHQLALEVENIVKELEVSHLKTAGAGDAKKLLIVQNTGAAAWKALSGDATISEAGVMTIANEAITAAKILALAITEAKIAGEAVATSKIANLAVTAAKLAAEAVETAKIQNLAVTEGKLAALAVGTAKLAELSVTTAKLAAECVTNAKIANGTIEDKKMLKPMIVGSVTEAGAVGSGTGFTVEHPSTGVYKIILTTELSELGLMFTQLTTKGGFIYPLAVSCKKIFELSRFKPNGTEVENGAFNFFVKVP